MKCPNCGSEEIFAVGTIYAEVLDISDDGDVDIDNVCISEQIDWNDARIMCTNCQYEWENVYALMEGVVETTDLEEDQ